LYPQAKTHLKVLDAAIALNLNGVVDKALACDKDRHAATIDEMKKL